MKENDLRDVLVESGFARTVTTDSTGKIISSRGLSLHSGMPIQDVFPKIDLSSSDVQEIFRRTAGGKEYYRAMVYSPSSESTEIFLQEISERVLATAELQKVMHLQSKVMKSIPDILIVKDRSGNWLGCNSAADELKGSKFHQNKEMPVLSPDCIESDEEAWNTRSIIRRDEVMADGTIYDVTKNALWNSDGSPQCLIVISKDVTCSRNREKKILNLNRLIKTLRGIDRLIITRNTPESLIRGVAETLTDSDLFDSCRIRLFSTDESSALTVTVPEDEVIKGDVFPPLRDHEWSDVSITGEELYSLLPELPGNGVFHIASKLSYGDRLYGVLLSRPSEEYQGVAETSSIEVISDIARDLSFSLHGFEMKKEQEKASAEVLKTRNMLDAFLEHFPGPAFIRDADSRYLVINNRLRKTAGYANWMRKAPEDIYPEDVAAVLHQRDHEVIEKGYVLRVRKVLDENGTEHSFETHYFRIDQETGPLIGGVALDITERLETEEALVRSEERYRAIYENTGTAMAILDYRGMIVSSNANIFRLSGYTPEEVVNRKAWQEFVHPDDLKAVAASREKRLRGQVDLQQEYEFRLRRKDGTYRNVRMCTGTIPNSGGMGVLSISDITSLMDYQNQLNYSLEKTKAILSSIPDLMFVLSRNGDYLDYFVYDEEKLAMPADRIFQSSIHDIGLSAESCARVSNSIERTIDTGTPCEVEYDIQMPDGRHYFEAGMSPLKAETVLVLCRDVTARKKAEGEQRKLEAQIRHVQKLESLGVLAGGIAHDFNNILMAITGNMYLARNSLSKGNSPLEYLDAVDKATSRASDLAGQMLAYSGRGEVSIKPLSINSAVEEIADILNVSISKKAKVIYRPDPDIPLILADGTQIRQVVMNLLTNASEALGQTPGTITLSTGSMYCDKDYIRTLNRTEKLNPGRYVWLQVEDTGQGISEDHIDRIFDPFFTTKFTGRGLGLSAVLGIMSSHGGAVKIVSRPCEGSSFRALFPASAGVKEEISEPVLSSSEFRGEGSVLFVDDEPLIRSVAEAMISEIGFNVISAEDGLDGLNMFKESMHEIRLVILDLTMPNMDGDEVFREIRKLKQDIPVLISSGYNENEILARFSDTVPDGFLKKPYSAAQLEGKIRTILFA